MNPEDAGNWQSWAAPVVVGLAFLWLVFRRRLRRKKSKGCDDCGS